MAIMHPGLLLVNYSSRLTAKMVVVSPIHLNSLSLMSSTLPVSLFLIIRALLRSWL